MSIAIETPFGNMVPAIHICGVGQDRINHEMESIKCEILRISDIILEYTEPRHCVKRDACVEYANRNDVRISLANYMVRDRQEI